MSVITKTYWKRFGGSVTALKNKYFGDPFFQGKFNVIILQIIFAVSLILIVSFYFNHQFHKISQAILDGIFTSVRSNENATGEAILQSAKIINNQNFVSFSIFAFIITALFSYFVAKVTLAPIQNALKSQKRFISDIAHELRTPISIIKTNSEVALIDANIDPKLKKVFESNIEELNRTSEIINNLLSFSNFVNPHRMNFSEVNMGQVVDGAVDKMRDLALTKHLELKVKKIEPNSVWGNSTALEQITLNLLKNAINYTPDGGHVDVGVEPDYRGSVILKVQDSGIGISSHDLTHIFEPFYRAVRSRSRNSGSSGLGLTIVSELVKLHAGKITIKSSVNKGTTALVSLPYSDKHKDYIPNKNETDRNGMNELSINF